MNAQEKFAWQPSDLVPDWLSLTPDNQRADLVRLLATAPLSRHEQANKMLVTRPWPADEADAQARIATVNAYLTMGAV